MQMVLLNRALSDTNAISILLKSDAYLNLIEWHHIKYILETCFNTCWDQIFLYLHDLSDIFIFLFVIFNYALLLVTIYYF